MPITIALITREVLNILKHNKFNIESYIML